MMTSTERALNNVLVRMYADNRTANNGSREYTELTPLKDKLLMSMWAQQISTMIEALHEWTWKDIYDYITKFGTIEITVFRKCIDADHDYWAKPDEVTDDAFDSLWAYISDASLHAGEGDDASDVIIEDIPEGESRVIRHPNYPQFYLLVSVTTSVMYQSDDYFMHKFTIKHGGVPAEQQTSI